MKRLPVLLPALLSAIFGAGTLLTGMVPTAARQALMQEVAPLQGTFTLMATGDIMLSRFVDTVIEKQGDLHYPYKETATFIQSADIAFANLENPVIDGPKMPHTGLTFRMDPEMVAPLRDAGFDVVSIANNHMSDQREEGLLSSRELLNKAGIATMGAGANESEARAPAFIERNGLTIAFLAYGDGRMANQVHFAGKAKAGIALATDENFAEDIAHAKTQADVVIVSLHSGNEYRETPDRTQQSLARAAVDAGADLVLGRHPHVLQPIERYNGKVIAYSLGNFIFDQMWSQPTRQGAMVFFAFSGSTITNIEAVPIEIHNHAQPRIATGATAQRILKRLGINE